VGRPECFFRAGNSSDFYPHILARLMAKGGSASPIITSIAYFERALLLSGDGVDGKHSMLGYQFIAEHFSYAFSLAFERSRSKMASISDLISGANSVAIFKRSHCLLKITMNKPIPHPSHISMEPGSFSASSRDFLDCFSYNLKERRSRSSVFSFLRKISKSIPSTSVQLSLNYLQHPGGSQCIFARFNATFSLQDSLPISLYRRE
jgi:hypothetical protein